jgi:hypothetical protein
LLGAFSTAAVGVPAWRAGRVDTETAEMFQAVLWVVLILPVVPWHTSTAATSPPPGEDTAPRRDLRGYGHGRTSPDGLARQPPAEMAGG